MTLIKFLVFIRARGAIEPCLFVAYFLIFFSYSSILFSPFQGKARIYSLRGEVYNHQKLGEIVMVNKKGCSKY